MIWMWMEFATFKLPWEHLQKELGLDPLHLWETFHLKRGDLSLQCVRKDQMEMLQNLKQNMEADAFDPFDKSKFCTQRVKLAAVKRNVYDAYVYLYMYDHVPCCFCLACSRQELNSSQSLAMKAQSFTHLSWKLCVGSTYKSCMSLVAFTSQIQISAVW